MSTKSQADLAEAEVRVPLAEARKVEAEAAEIEAKTEERRLRTQALAASWAISLGLIAFGVVSITLGGGFHAGNDLSGHWLPTMLPRP